MRIVRQYTQAYVTLTFGQSTVRILPFDATRIYLAVYPISSNTIWGLSTDPNVTSSTIGLIGGAAGLRGYFELTAHDAPEMIKQSWYYGTTSAGTGNVAIVHTVTELVLPDSPTPVTVVQSIGDSLTPGAAPGAADGPEAITTWTQQLRRLLRRRV